MDKKETKVPRIVDLDEIRTETSPLIPQPEGQVQKVEPSTWSIKNFAWEYNYIILDLLLFAFVAYEAFGVFLTPSQPVCVAKVPYLVNTTYKFSPKDFDGLKVVINGNTLPSKIEFRQEAVDDVEFDVDILISDNLKLSDLHLKNPRNDRVYTLDIEGPQNFGFGCFRAEVVVKLPMDLKKFKSIYASLPNGKITSELNMHPYLTNFDLHVGSGEIEVVDTKSEKLRLVTGSGDISVTDVNATEIYLHTGSGNIQVNQIFSNLTSISSGSGDIEVGFSTSVDTVIRASSGDVNTNHFTSDSLTLAISSGNANLELAKVHELKARTSSGSLKVALDSLEGRTTPSNFSRLSLVSSSGYVELSLPKKYVGHFYTKSNSGTAQVFLPSNRTDFTFIKNTQRLKEGYHIDKSSLNSIDMITSSGNVALIFI